MGDGFSPAERTVLYRVIESRRDVRAFRADPIATNNMSPVPTNIVVLGSGTTVAAKTSLFHEAKVMSNVAPAAILTLAAGVHV
jgi:hypothetical protein